MMRRQGGEVAFWSSEDEFQAQMLAMYKQFSTAMAVAEANPTEEYVRTAWALADNLVDYAYPYIPNSTLRVIDAYLADAAHQLQIGDYRRSLERLRTVRRLIVRGWHTLRVIGRRRVEAEPIEDEALRMLEQALEREGERNGSTPTGSVQEAASGKPPSEHR